MDTQQIRNYLELVQALLRSSNGQEIELFQQHQDLLDEGLLQMMILVAETLRQQGQENNANRLNQIAVHLAQVIVVTDRIKVPEPTMFGDLQSILQAISEINNLGSMVQRVALCQQALQLVSRQDDEELWAWLQNELGHSLIHNLKGNRAENIEEAITAYRQALQVRTRATTPAEWIISMHNLATAYSNRIRGNRADNIEEAITIYRQALDVGMREAMPAEWAALIHDLATAYDSRILGNRADNIEEAITGYQQALKVMTREAMPVEWATLTNSLAAAYSNRIRGARADNIERAIDISQQSLQVVTRETMPVDWAMSMHTLATAYYSRIRGDRADNIEEAINVFRQSLQVRTREKMPIDWAMSMHNLANAFANRIRGDRADNIERAIYISQQVLQVLTREALPVEWASSMHNLAVAYSNRIRGDRADNIERAIAISQQSLQVRTRAAMPVDWASSMHDLGTAYHSRIRGTRATNIEEAIAAYRQALQVRTQEAMPIKWAMSMHNLATAFSNRDRGNRASNIEEAIAAYRQALQVRTQEAMPLEWAASMHNMATAYYSRIWGNRADNIEEAIAAYQQVLEVMAREVEPVDWATLMNNLATAYRHRIRGNRADNIEEAISTYSQALEIFTSETHPSECRRTARLLVNLYVDEEQWDKAQIHYELALNAVEVLYQAALSKGSQEAELSETNDLYRRAAYAYAKVGDLTTAIATLEQGRARGLSETLQRDRADLESIRQSNPDLAERYLTASAAITQLESTERLISRDSESPAYSEEEFRQQSIQARQALKACLAKIRQTSEYENFLALPTFDDVAATVQPDYPLVYLLSTPNGSLALILTTAGISDLWLTDLTELKLIELYNDWVKAYNDSRTNRQAWFDTIENVTHQLWNWMMGPLINHLQQNNRSKAILIPTGYLSYLPLHTAWTPAKPNGRRYAIDDIQFTYAPNALSLNGAARTVATHTSDMTLLAIKEPHPVSFSPLPSSEYEIDKAVSTFGTGNCEILQGENATRLAVLEHLSRHNVVHFACHGAANPGMPLNSGLLMANNETLSLRDFLDLKLQNLRLAILSACETGIPGTQLPDEVISLPTGLLQAGAAGVVSSLWSVDDRSTMLLISRFYDLWRTENLDPPEALRQAQIWLRDSNDQNLTSYQRDIVFAQEEEHYQSPFAHPFHWAAFTYVGV